MAHPALLFPGQGSQEVGMGRDLAEANTDIMELWKKAEKISGIALREIYWDGDEEAMPQTINLQPALTTANLACWFAIAGKVQPSCTGGHSLGELSSLVAAQVLPFEDILELATLRGRLMNQADPDGKGAMAAIVKVNLETVTECVERAHEKTNEMLIIAHYNTPAQYVVSGTKTAIAAVTDEVKAVKGRAIPLAVSGAFHSPLMADASAEFAKAINAIPATHWNNARFAVYSNASATPATDKDIIKNLFIQQMTSSVFWIDTIKNQWHNGARHFIECGPKQVLTKMTPTILKGFTNDEEPLCTSVGTLEAVQTVLA